MRQRRLGWLSRAAAIAMAMICVCLCAVPGIAHAKDSETSPSEQTARKTVRVGYYPVSDYQDTAEDGSHSGFGYDYYMQIQKYTRWDYEFVEASYADCMKMLMTGEIDVMSGLLKTSEREKSVLFTDYSVSNTQNKLYARADEDDIYYEDYEGFDGCKVASMKGTLTTELDAYCSNHGFSVEKVEFDTLKEMEDALINGDIDLVYATSINADIDTKIVARMSKIPLYYAVSKSQPEILEELNSALQMIIDNNPDFYTQMSDKYMVSGANAIATFTKEEFDYIQSGEPVYVILNSNWAPISWYDETTGKFKGIFVDVLEYVEEYSGLTFQYCTEDEFNKIAAKNPKVINDVLAILADDNVWADKQSVMMSNRVVDSSVVKITKRSSHQKEEEEHEVIALPNRFYIGWRMQDEFKDDKVVYYDTVEECLNAINAGDADTTYVNELVATYYLSMLEYSNLFATANSGYNEDLAFAVNKDTDKPLLGILDKSLLCIAQDDMDQIIIQNSIAEQKLSLRGIYYSNPALVIGTILAVALLVLGIAFCIYQILSRRKRMAMELEQEFETSQARTEFFMMISHELRTPLNAIVGYLDLAAECCSSGNGEAEYIKRSQNAARQLEDIAKDMLDYTRISSNSAQLHEGVFDLKEIIRGVEQNVSVNAKEKNITFRFTITDIEQEYVIGDRLRIAQLMQNILSNSVKFTDAGGEIHANVNQVKREDGTLELTFVARDNGKGMSEEYLERVCAPFNQSDKAYSRTHGGLGLGLYLTKYYLDAMHGQMEVTSKLGEGSTFTLHFPLKLADARQFPKQDISFAHVRALVAGTSSEENEQLKALLRRLKIKSDAVKTDALAAKRILTRSNSDFAYSLCILDESILDETYSLIDTIAAYEKPPVIFVFTSNAKVVDELSGNEKVCQVLYKPIFQSVLFDAVMDTFGEYEVEEKTAASADFSGTHALIVEDNMVNADILRRILQRANVKTTLCENGKVGADTFISSNPGTYQIIFMDIQMPVMTGYEAAEQIRSSNHEQAGTVPIVAVSANAFPEDIEKSLQAGMNEHLSKPIRPEVLYREIAKWVKE